MFSRLEFYIFSVIIILIGLSCQTKIFTYERNTTGISERFIVNFSKNQFEYYVDSSSLKYHAHGATEIHKDIIQFEFPHHAEVLTLSPFKKGYYKLVKISENDTFELSTKFYNV